VIRDPQKNPDRHQNRIDWSWVTSHFSPKFQQKSVYNFCRCFVQSYSRIEEQIQTDRDTNEPDYIISRRSACLTC